jgi:hypothetical protein
MRIASPHWRCAAYFQEKDMSGTINSTEKTNYYKHNEKNGLYEARENGTNIEVSSQGGGFVINYTKEQFLKNFTLVEEIPELKKGTVTADFLGEGVSIDCYSNGLRWNGWGRPLFDRASAERAVSLLTHSDLRFEGDVIEYDNDQFEPLEPHKGENLPFFQFHPKNHIVNGVELQLWEIGDGWCWNCVKFETIESV